MSGLVIPSVTYELIFFLETRTLANNGKREWRYCRATRIFQPGELPHVIPPQGMLITASLAFKPVAYRDYFDANGMRAIVEFHYHVLETWRYRQGIQYAGRHVPCIDPGHASFSDRAFLAKLQQLGFTVSIDKPIDREPAVIPR